MTEDNKKPKRANSKNMMSKLKDHFYAFSKTVSGKKFETWDEVWEEFKENVENDLKYFTKSVIRPFKHPKDKNAPVKRRSAYIFYCMSERDNVKKQHPDYKGTQISTELGAKWKKLTDEQKSVYQAKSEEDKKRYEKEISKYNISKLRKNVEVQHLICSVMKRDKI